MPELIWYGKYDQEGNRNGPLRVALPFQTVETVNESAQERQMSLDRLLSGRDPEWRNRLIWGDKKYVLPSLLPEFAGKVDLIYIDPPFDTGADFSYRVQIDGEDFVKEPSIIEQKAYRDTWGVSPAERQAGANHLDRYLRWFYETVVLLRELLSDTGSIYVHCDWRVNSYLRMLLDEVFGRDNFRNEIIWKRKTGRGQTNKEPTEFGTQTDSILFFSKSQVNRFANVIKPLRQAYIDRFYRHTDETGRRYRIDNLASPSPRPNLM